MIQHTLCFRRMLAVSLVAGLAACSSSVPPGDELPLLGPAEGAGS